VAPAVAIGASGEHADFPGTLSIGSAALTGVAVELGRSATVTAPRLVFCNGHGGNVEALTRAVDVLRAEGRSVVLHTPTFTGGDAHAGRTETSLMLALAPDAVRLDRLEAGVVAPLPDLWPRLRRDGVRAVSPNGVLGDPQGASADEGRRLLEEAIGALVAACASLGT
ncbi:MAG: mycofactocin biosynthesis peptidyl-dipeptidase MftE, partial [Actinomyces sp.]